MRQILGVKDSAQYLRMQGALLFHTVHPSIEDHANINTFIE